MLQRALFLITFFTLTISASGQRSTRQCQIEASELRFKQLIEKIEYYSSIILNTDNEKCDEIINLYSCYSAYLNELKENRGFYNLLVRRYKVREKNITRLLKKSSLNPETLELISSKYRHCKQLENVIIEDLSIDYEESRKRSDEKIEYDLESLEKQGDFDVTVYQKDDDALWEIPIMSYYEEDYNPGYYSVPNKAGSELNRFIKFIKEIADRDTIPVTNISIYITGYADGLKVNNAKYKGTNIENLGKDTSKYVINKYKYFPNNQKKPILRPTGTTFKMNQKFRSNERLALARTIEPRIIMEKHLRFAKFYHGAVDFKNRTGGDYRKARAIILLPGYFKEIKQLLKEGDKAKFEKFDNQPIDIISIIEPFRSND